MVMGMRWGTSEATIYILHFSHALSKNDDKNVERDVPLSLCLCLSCIYIYIYILY